MQQGRFYNHLAAFFMPKYARKVTSGKFSVCIAMLIFEINPEHFQIIFYSYMRSGFLFQASVTGHLDYA